MDTAISGHEPRPRSAFVTATAWTTIIILTYALFSGLREFSSAPAGQVNRWLIFLVISAAAMAAALGLLTRKEWARKLFIGVISFAIPWNLHITYVAIFVYKAVLSSLYFLIAYDIVVCALFAWLVYKLCTHGIRAEFD